jgi:hypothetical protein
MNCDIILHTHQQLESTVLYQSINAMKEVIWTFQ